MLTAARKLGLSLAEYRARIARGLKHCLLCREWHPRGEFGTDLSRYDGLTSSCRGARNARQRQDYAPRPRPPKGRFYAQPREQDRTQARHRVNYYITAGLLSVPNDLPCTDCGHEYDGVRRHEYDHYLGYAAEHHLDVQVVCSRCHHARTESRKRS